MVYGGRYADMEQQECEGFSPHIKRISEILNTVSFSDLCQKIVVYEDNNQITIHPRYALHDPDKANGRYTNDDNQFTLTILEHDGEVIITDNGWTREYMKKYFDVASPDMRELIKRTAEHYGVSTRDKRITIRVKNEEQIMYAIFRILYCINFLEVLRVMS